MKNKILMLCGILAPVIYVFTVVLGGFLNPEYSHVEQPVSDLIATGAPDKALLDALLAMYNLVTIGFGFGLLGLVRADHQNRRRLLGLLGAICLVAEGVFGLITLFFPEDAGGLAAGISATGAMHIAFAGLSSVTSMLAILLMAFWFRNNLRLRAFGLYSFVSVLVIFVSGGLAAVSVANQSPFAGFLERITIGGFLQWMFVVGFVLYLSERRIAVPYSVSKPRA